MQETNPTETKFHPQAYFASHAQLYSWYEKLLEAAIKTTASGDTRYVYEALEHINPNNWVETETQAAPYYVVQPGDTLGMIALKYGRSSPEDQQELVQLNHRMFLNEPHQIIAEYNLLIPIGWREAPTTGVHLDKSNFDD